MLLQMSIPDLIDRELKQRKMSERALAGYLGVSSNAVNAWHTGKRTPDPAYCQMLADYFGLPVDQVLAEAGHKKPDTGEVPPSIDPSVTALLNRMTPDEQRRFALPAIRLAEELIREAREQGK